MIVRFGYVAMSMIIKDSSPSKTMTMTAFSKLNDRDAAIRKLESIAKINLHNTLRLLKHNIGNDIRVYRFSSKLIPLATHEDLQDWDPFAALKDAFDEVGRYVRNHQMRVSLHPDHFTVLSTPRQEVFQNSVRDLRHHVKMLKAMGLNATAKNNIHIGGAYQDKQTAAGRFKEHFGMLDPDIQQRLTLENDDKTFTAAETLEVCKATGLPMVLDIHHQWVNNDGEKPWELWQDILKTWTGSLAQADADPDHLLPPKIHVSSPKSGHEPRSHADLVDPALLLAFLREIAGSTPAVDVMIEAKHKDAALFDLMRHLANYESEGIKILNGASIEVSG